MSKTAKNQSYYQHYGLTRDPFPIQSFDNTLILTPELNNRLDRIKSLITFSDKLVVVTASFGAGKSIIADYLESIPEKNWMISLVQADIKMEKESLAYEIIQQFTPDRADVPAKSIPQLHKYLEFSSKNEIIPVIIIDDAHKLPTKALEFILELAALQYGETRFRFVLFADETITDRLEQEQLADLTAALVYKVNLPVLSMEQLREYLNNRLSSSGDIKSYPFTEEDVGAIFFKTGGVPRSINIVAREIMETRMGKTGSLFGQKQLLIAAGATAVVVIALYLSLFRGTNEISEEKIVARYQDQQPQIAPVPPTSLSSISATADQPSPPDEQADAGPVTIPGPAIEVQPGPVEVTDLPASADDDLPTQGGRDSPVQASAIVPDDMDESADSADIVLESRSDPGIIDEPGTIASNLAMADWAPGQNQLPKGEDDSADNPVAEPETSAEADPLPTSRLASNTPAANYVQTGRDDNIFKLENIPDPVRDIRGENWYRQQSRSDYTLQLISASDINNVLSLLEGLDEFHDEMSGYVKYTPSGKPRYLLFFGLYPNREMADNAAASSVPDKLRAIKPYPRSVGNILDEIEDVGYWPR